METLTAETKISGNGQLTLSMPDAFKGASVIVTVQKKEDPDQRDALGWPVGFFETFVGCITDETFKRLPQGEADPIPSLE
jgi:hypothetical protein